MLAAPPSTSPAQVAFTRAGAAAADGDAAADGVAAALTGGAACRGGREAACALSARSTPPSARPARRVSTGVRLMPSMQWPIPDVVCVLLHTTRMFFGC